MAGIAGAIVLGYALSWLSTPGPGTGPVDRFAPTFGPGVAPVIVAPGAPDAPGDERPVETPLQPRASERI